MNKEKLLKRVKEEEVASLEYRLMFSDKPTYVRLKARLSPRSDQMLVISVENIDTEVKNKLEAEVQNAQLNNMISRFANEYQSV